MLFSAWTKTQITANQHGNCFLHCQVTFVPCLLYHWSIISHNQEGYLQQNMLVIRVEWYDTIGGIPWCLRGVGYVANQCSHDPANQFASEKIMWFGLLLCSHMIWEWQFVAIMHLYASLLTNAEEESGHEKMEDAIIHCPLLSLCTPWEIRTAYYWMFSCRIVILIPRGPPK